MTIDDVNYVNMGIAEARQLWTAAAQMCLIAGGNGISGKAAGIPSGS